MAQPFIGEITMFGGNFAPRSYAFCDGALLPIAQNTALFSILGTTYGGDGRTTFGLPDLRGRIPVHAGRGPGLSQRRLGEKSGAETTALVGPNTNDPSDASLAAVETYSNLAADTLNAEMQAGSVEHPAPGDTGGGQPHNNMAPFQAISFIIAMQGTFPSLN